MGWSLKITGCGVEVEKVELGGLEVTRVGTERVELGGVETKRMGVTKIRLWVNRLYLRKVGGGHKSDG